jgi:hypothetical protein
VDLSPAVRDGQVVRQKQRTTQATEVFRRAVQRIASGSRTQPVDGMRGRHLAGTDRRRRAHQVFPAALDHRLDRHPAYGDALKDLRHRPAPGQPNSRVRITMSTDTAASATSPLVSAIAAQITPSWRLDTTSTSRPVSATRRAGPAPLAAGRPSAQSPSTRNATRSSRTTRKQSLCSRRLRKRGDKHLDARRPVQRYGRRPRHPLRQACSQVPGGWQFPSPPIPRNCAASGRHCGAPWVRMVVEVLGRKYR